MSNADARLAPTLPPPVGRPFGVDAEASRVENGTRRRLLVAVLFAGDLVSGAMAVAAAAAIVALIVALAAGQAGLVGRTQPCLLLLLLLGINCSLGLYRSNIRNPMERFRLRVSATLLFMFASALMWIRDGLIGRTGHCAGCWCNRTRARPVDRASRSRMARQDRHLQYPGGHPGYRRKQSSARPPAAQSPGCGLRPYGFIEDGMGTDDVADEFVARDMMPTV